MRRLLVTHRTVPLDRSDEYEAAWRILAAATGVIGAHAWLFRRTGHDDRFVEFIEAADTLPLDEPALAAALRALEEIAPGTTEELEEGGL